MKARPLRLILVDAGNTTCSVAVTEGPRVKRAGFLLTAEVTAGAALKFVKRLAGACGFDGAVLCSVAPPVNPAWLKALAAVSRTAPLRVTSRLDFGIAIRYPRPDTVGADRLVNASAAAARFGAPVVALDFGTALTCDVVSSDGAFVGGIIAPGMRLLLDYLHERTALLPEVPFAPVRRMVGRSTAEAMRIGAWAGYRGLVRELMAGLKAELGGGIRFCATGGDAARLKSILGTTCPIVPDLTFDGMRLVFALNKTGG
ncbi:MAG: type III pantothenate kinase [Kiritimatiellia bacterium]